MSSLIFITKEIKKINNSKKLCSKIMSLEYLKNFQAFYFYFFSILFKLHNGFQLFVYGTVRSVSILTAHAQAAGPAWRDLRNNFKAPTINATLTSRVRRRLDLRRVCERRPSLTPCR